MEESYGRPLPVTKGIAEKFWNALNQEKFLYQRCDDCLAAIFYPRVVCPQCMSDNLSWQTSSGKGNVYTYTVVYKPVDARFKPIAPYVVALIDLDEGIRVMGNIVGWHDPEAIQVGQRVAVEYQRVTDQITLPMFRVEQEG
ncbi:Zn-ribbon domain-containing OB-fold protein [Alicyclobacillus tolerans]|uniref:Zn-ribbon domain-containing OB-fold protein n=1 Tax=Alicyclobacillus tolerans TaxID=90970 RepID=UPI001F2E074B|nr:Zn-ribbon domain-containing OB-fold protein [Alicyclobacillus tolerans]MCF8565754.1 Zn-ribbon domain-containing OB-fold protein [Alicyclobacillus tolerans]